MKLLVPKPFRKNKLSIYKEFTLIDLAIIIAINLLSTLIGFLIPIDSPIRFVICIPFAIFSLFLVKINSKNDCKNYIYLWNWFKFKSFHKVYVKKPLYLETISTIDEIIDTGIENPNNFDLMNLKNDILVKNNIVNSTDVLRLIKSIFEQRQEKIEEQDENDVVLNNWINEEIVEETEEYEGENEK